jgi:dipeptidyl aminopeptidase/acylaminoacyl peptidase
VTAATVTVLWTSTSERQVVPGTASFLSVLPPRGGSLSTEEAPIISPDGRRVAFVGYDAGGRRVLYTRALDAAHPAALTNTEGASLPFWSPDGRAIGFFAQGKLKTIDLATGSLLTLADAMGARGGAWSSDDVILFVPRPLEGPY